MVGEEGDAAAEEDGDAGDGEFVDEVFGEEALDDFAAVDVEIAVATTVRQVNNLGRCSARKRDVLRKLWPNPTPNSAAQTVPSLLAGRSMRPKPISTRSLHAIHCAAVRP